MGTDCNATTGQKARVYSRRTDPAAWVIGIAAAIADVMVAGDSSSSQYPLACALGEFVGASILVLLAGALVCPIVSWVYGKTRPSALMSFGIGACGVVALTSVGEYQSRQFQAQQDALAVHQFIAQERPAMTGSGSAAPPHLANAGASENDSMLSLVQQCLAAGDKQNGDYERAITGLCGGGILQASNLGTGEKIATARKALAQLRSLDKDYEAVRLTLFRDTAKRIATLPGPPAPKAAFLAEYEQAVSEQRELLEQRAKVETEFADQAESLLDFMQSKLGTFKISGQTVYFDGADDVASFNAIIAHLDELAAQESQVVRQSQEFGKQSLDSMEQACTAQ
ncbi:MAG TPA: DUF3053 family protein [Tepidisphaeraceae bacterium]|nr:DUF3053 family protein [Tepidisphaeraceae bacterium]